MKDETEVNEASDRAAVMVAISRKMGRSQHHGMTYEEGLRDALDWVAENIDEDPTIPE